MASAATREFGLEASAHLISTDVGRTFAHTGLFDAQGPLADELRAVLEAHCYYRPDIGYVQGMSFLAGMLLMHSRDDYAAFLCLANLLSRPLFQSFFRSNDEVRRACLLQPPCISIYLSIHLSIYPSIYLSIYLSIYQFGDEFSGVAAMFRSLLLSFAARGRLG